jgi:hypothetical protein
MTRTGRTKGRGTTRGTKPAFNVVVVGQAGRLQYEAALFCASFRAANARFSRPPLRGRTATRAPLDPRSAHLRPGRAQPPADLGAEILPFEATVFGESYPYGNKIECLGALPEGEPFVFFDTDTLILGDLMEVPFDFDRPSASLPGRRHMAADRALWPGLHGDLEIALRPVRHRIRSIARPWQPDEYWRRYLYFNAGFFYAPLPAANSAPASLRSRAVSATTRRRSLSARRSTHGSTRSRCPW